MCTYSATSAKGFIPRPTHEALGWQVGLEDLFVRGRVRVTARPLLERLPCVSAIQVSFVGMPKYSFDLRVYGGNVRMLPGVQAYLNQLVRDSLR